MRKKKILAMILVAMLSLSGLTGCSDKDKADISNKLNNKTTETTKKDDSKPADKTSESTDKSDNKKSDSTSKPSDDKKSDSASTGSTSSNKKPGSASQNSNAGSASKPDNSTASKPSHSNSNNSSAPSKPAGTKPAHQHTWVDHTATKQVPRTVHHDAVYETVTIPAVTKWQRRCEGCGQWFDNLDDLAYHALTSPVNAGCGCTADSGVREVVITPAHTEQKLVKDAWDETVYDTQTYVDYQYCSGCGQHK